MALIWHAKPSGGYGYNSNEGIDNITCINGFFNGRGYTLQAQAGVIANIIHESALNPWRWQEDKYSENGDSGYGLFQFTPGRHYWQQCYDVDGYAPNRSPFYQSDFARPSDGYAHLVVFDEDILGKWQTLCWRFVYWDRNQYPGLWQMRNTILANYGTNGELSLAQFRTIDNVSYATFAFLACYEGPLVPNFYEREVTALAIYQMLSGETPPPPTPPPGPGPEPPTPVFGDRNKIIFYLKPFWKRGF